MHERGVGTGEQETFGTALDCHRHTTSLTGKRFWRLYKALGALLRRKSLTGQALEIVLGHCTCCALVDRRVLSCFHTAYCFVQSNYSSAAFMWPTVRHELECFSQFDAFLISPWRLPWSTVLHAAERSLIGFGATRANLPLSVIEEHGRLSERTRFKQMPAISAREHALV